MDVNAGRPSRGDSPPPHDPNRAAVRAASEVLVRGVAAAQQEGRVAPGEEAREDQKAEFDGPGRRAIRPRQGGGGDIRQDEQGGKDGDEGAPSRARRSSSWPEP